jgi:hypothetical protein
MGSAQIFTVFCQLLSLSSFEIKTSSKTPANINKIKGHGIKI